MKKTIIGIAVALSLSGQAFAGDYSDGVARQQMCGEWGEIATALFNGRDDPKIRAEGKATSKALDEEFARLINAEGFTRKSVMIKSKSAVIGHALFLAKSSKESYMNAWGNCMDLPDEE
jgi:hypothetical protein